MDLKINNKSSQKKSYKKYILFILTAIAVLTAGSYLYSLSQSDFSIDRDSIDAAEVKAGKFTVLVRGSGVLVPENIRWLSAGVEAKVERLMVKAGDEVKKGDPIMILKNQELEDLLAESKWELEAMIEQVNAEKIADETVLLSQENAFKSARLAHSRAITEFEARKKLVETGAVSQLDYERARVEMQQAEQLSVSEQKQVEQVKQNNLAQEKMRHARLEQFRKRVGRIERQVEDLQVKATLDSIVIDMPLEIGERVQVGANVAKLAEKNSLIAELQIPEIKIRDVVKGQSVLIDTLNSKFEGKVTRIDPAVVNGNVQVDVAFSDPLPVDARPDLSVDGEIKITETDNTLFVRRPLFVQGMSTSSVYKIIDGNIAQRVEVQWRHGSVNQIEIAKGLQQGDRIIVSDPSRFESYERLRIN